jgi:hypothetical protein
MAIVNQSPAEFPLPSALRQQSRSSWQNPLSAIVLSQFPRCKN